MVGQSIIVIWNSTRKIEFVQLCFCLTKTITARGETIINPFEQWKHVLCLNTFYSF